MQPSMGTLKSTSLRVVKDNFGIGESSPNFFLNMLNLYWVKFEAQ